nr:MAG TPA: L SHAPED TAIL FIBER PROTEIN [Caudoviricetes sp.]
MNRIISLSVEDMYIKYTGEAFGATGSHNAVTLRMTFGPAWEGTAKTAYFTDALGNTSVALVLGLDTLVDGAYEVDVPSEALKTAGVATITIKGVLVSGETTTKAITTAAGHFRVLDSELPDSAGSAGTITPSDKDQLQAEIAGMEALFTTAKAAAEAAAANAKVSETNAKTSETAAASFASSAEASKTAAAESAATATAQASAADASAAKAAASQKAAQAAETNAKVSEKAAAASQASAETAAKSAQDSAAAAAKSAQTAQGAASTATNAASSADHSATFASGSASQAQASAAAAAGSAAGAETASKTAQSWAVGGTNTRPGEDTDNAKYWAKQAEAVVGGDFATKNEAQGYVTAHNQSDAAHADIRNALNGKEASGTAAAAVTAHNKDTAAHQDIRNALAGKETAGAAAAVQSNLTAHAGNTTVHVTSEEKTTWNGKAAGKHASQHGKDGADPITPDAIGAASLGADGKVPASQLPEISSVKTYTATIGTTWVEDENTGVKTQSVAIAGVTAQNTALVDHAYTGAGTSDDYAAFVEAENQYLNCITNGYAETYDGGIKFTIFGDANTVAIPIVAEVS